MTPRRFWGRKRWLMATDALLLNLAGLGALFLRFAPDPIPSDYLSQFLVASIPLTLLALVCFWGLRLYSISWRYVGSRDLLAVLQGVTLVGGLQSAFFLAVASPPYPRGVLVIQWLLAMLGIGGVRLSLRSLVTLWPRLRSGGARGERLLIVGAGDYAEALARDLERRPDRHFRLVGFIDDDPAKWGTVIHRAPVFGPVERIAEVAERLRVEQIIVAIPSATGRQIRRLIALCESLPVKLRIAPGFQAMTGPGGGGHVAVRDVAPEDLLRRPPVRMNLEEIAAYLQGEVVLITGAGGSIGSELVRQVARVRPRRIVLLGRGENSIFEIEQEARAELENSVEVLPVIADVRDRDHMERIFEQFRPGVVFHAAAHKHVPLMESYPAEAVKNNVGGTWNLLRLSSRFGVKRFVLISTDKAVNPTSVMGATKRVAELLLQAEAARGSGTRFMAVRFGNVLGSRGSVLQTMSRQISKQQPVTVTDTRMVRYFMTIPEAVQLVIQAGALGRAGEVFLLDMGHPVNILELARDLIRLSGLVPDRDIPIRITGARPGERLYEEMLTRDEGVSVTRHERIFKAPALPADPEWVHRVAERLILAAERGDTREIVSRLQELIPTYTPSPFVTGTSEASPSLKEVRRGRLSVVG